MFADYYFCTNLLLKSSQMPASIKLQTQVTDIPCKSGISYKDKIIMLGSCFSDNIGHYLSDYGFDVLVNPFGTLYNPLSIAGAVERLVNRTSFTIGDCVRMGSGSEKICSFYHHTSFARESAEEFLSNANNELEKACDFFEKCNKVIITLGTSWYFKHIGTDKVVANCLKRNAAEFKRRMLSAAESADALCRIANLCGTRNIIFTVSPIRHMADGAHGNQLSKSSLLLAVDKTVSICSGNAERNGLSDYASADYFPSYEIMMDELRDYRFYAEDMTHPSSQAIRYILERFLDWALPSEESGLLDNNIRKFRQSRHKAINSKE